MQPSATPSNKTRFGMFEVDLSAGELRKNGRKVPLENQPFQLLVLLLNRAGEVVTREELQKALWADGTFVEFEHGVNTAVNKIRQALGDSARNPRFIETLPRKGYRFIAPVAGIEPQGPAPIAPARRRPLWILVFVALAVLVGAIAFWRPSRAPEAGLTPVPLTSYAGKEDSPSFSPDGTQVAFEWCQEGEACQIYVKQIGVEPPIRLTDHPAGSFGPAWSPDGQTIAFLRDHAPPKTALILIPQRGGRERVIAEFDRLAYREMNLNGPYLAWTPDSKWLVSVGAVGYEPSLFLVSVETGEKRRLTAPRPGSVMGDTAPAFSPDGRRLVFTRRGFNACELYVVFLAGDYMPQGKPERIALGKPAILGAAWTPDGSEIVFSSGSSGTSGLSRMTPSKSAKPRTLAFSTGQASTPTVSRKGNRLVYVVPRTDVNVWRVDFDIPGHKPGIPVRFIASTQSESHPAYSPDGKRIAFRSDRSGAPEIWVCESDGSNPVQLTSFGGPFVFGPRWSWDSQNIAFTVATENADIYSIGANGGPPRRLTTHPANDKWPYWSRDGQWLYFSSLRGQVEIWKIPSSGGEAAQITRNEGDVPEESPDRKYLYYMKGWPTQCSVWRMPTEGGEETKVLDSVHWMGQWTVGKDGIYFFTAPNELGHSDLSLYEFSTGKIRKIQTVERPLGIRITISPDGRTVLYPQVDEAGSDLMLVENFR